MLSLYVCVMCGAHGIQRRALDLLTLKLDMVVSYHVGDGTDTQVFCRKAKRS